MNIFFIFVIFIFIAMPILMIWGSIQILKETSKRKKRAEKFDRILDEMDPAQREGFKEKMK